MEFSFFNLVVSVLRNLIAFPLKVWQWGKRRIHLIRLGAKFPGPFALPIIGNAFDGGFIQNSNAFWSMGVGVMLKYRPLYRFYMGPILVITMENPKDNEHIISGYKFVNKTPLYSKFLKPWLGDGLLISSGSKWRSRRKILTPAFHFKILDQFQAVFQSCGEQFVSQLTKRAGGASFDVWPLVKLLTLDIICETAMGVQMNAQTDSGSTYVNAVEEIVTLTVERLLKPWLHPDFIFHQSPSGRRYKKCLQVLHGTTEKVIRERREEFLKISENLEQTNFDIDEIGQRRRVAFLDILLLQAQEGNLSDTDIREEVDTFMFEGHDTTASAISFIMFELSRCQDVQKKILEELKTVFVWSQPLEPTVQQLSELKYLEMVIKESLRKYPPVPIIFRGIHEDEELPTSGHVLPAGCIINVSIYGVHHNPTLFPEPLKFDPERFSPDESAQRHPFAYLPFSAGPRNCIGMRFAMLELKSVLAKVVWHFRLLPEEGFEPQMSWKLILKSENGLRMRLEQRR